MTIGNASQLVRHSGRQEINRRSTVGVLLHTAAVFMSSGAYLTDGGSVLAREPVALALQSRFVHEHLHTLSRTPIRAVGYKQ